MSLQDDIFDIEHILKNKKGHREAFGRVCKYIDKLESEIEKNDHIVSVLYAAVAVFQDISNDLKVKGKH